jgi:hypothetical protein
MRVKEPSRKFVEKEQCAYREHSALETPDRENECAALEAEAVAKGASAQAGLK